MYLFYHKNGVITERLKKEDMPYTVAMVLLEIIAPILLMLGVKLGTSANASLLGNFEIVATTMIALLFFKEKVTLKLWTAIGLITLPSLLLGFAACGLRIIYGAERPWCSRNKLILFKSALYRSAFIICVSA